MPVDNPGFSRQQYNQPNYGATMPVDNPGFSRQPVQQTNIQAGYGQQPVQHNAPKNKPPKNKKQGSKMSVGWLIALCASIVVIIVGVAIICFISVGKKKQINNVKDSSIKLTNASYSTTYGELFGKSITNGKWDYFKEDGEKLVQVKGDYKDPGSGSSFPVIVQFNVDDGVKLSCVAVNGVAYSLADSENFITLMYIAYYGTDDEKPSFFQEYKYKLEKLYDRFYTKRGNEIAKERQKMAVAFYSAMLKEVSDSYDRGIEMLKKFTNFPKFVDKLKKML